MANVPKNSRRIGERVKARTGEDDRGVSSLFDPETLRDATLAEVPRFYLCNNHLPGTHLAGVLYLSFLQYTFHTFQPPLHTAPTSFDGGIPTYNLQGVRLSQASCASRSYHTLITHVLSTAPPHGTNLIRWRRPLSTRSPPKPRHYSCMSFQPCLNTAPTSFDGGIPTQQEVRLSQVN